MTASDQKQTHTIFVKLLKPFLYNIYTCILITYNNYKTFSLMNIVVSDIIDRLLEHTQCIHTVV